MGGLLIGLSTFQAEFDFGVPQFRAVLQPALIALRRRRRARGGAGVDRPRRRARRGAVLPRAARHDRACWSGRCSARRRPACRSTWARRWRVEAAALLLARRPAGARRRAAGSPRARSGSPPSGAGPRSRCRCRGSRRCCPRGSSSRPSAGTAGGVLGGLIGTALRGELPRPAVARAVAAVRRGRRARRARGRALRDGAAARARASCGRPATAALAVRLEPRDAARDAAWLQVTAWQGGGLVVDRLEPDGAGGWRTTRPIPLDGDWKVFAPPAARARTVLGAPVRLPADPAIPAAAVPPPAEGTTTRAFVPGSHAAAARAQGRRARLAVGRGLGDRAGAGAAVPRLARLGAGPRRAQRAPGRRRRAYHVCVSHTTTNTFGALALAVADRVQEAVAAVAGHGASGPAALVALDGFAGGGSIDALAPDPGAHALRGGPAGRPADRRAARRAPDRARRAGGLAPSHARGAGGSHGGSSRRARRPSSRCWWGSRRPSATSWIPCSAPCSRRSWRARGGRPPGVPAVRRRRLRPRARVRARSRRSLV